MKPFIIAIAGGSGSGKTTLAKKLAKDLNATLISTDHYYLDQSHLSMTARDKINFDHPDSIEWTLFEKHIKALSESRTVDMPQYEFETHTRKIGTIKVCPKKYIIIEGILALHNKRLNKIYDYKIFVNIREEIRMKRRLDRDIKERGRTKASTIRMWNTNVKPMHDKYVEPSKKYADIIVDNDYKYIKLIKEKIQSLKNEK